MIGVKHDKSALNQYATLKHLLDAFLALLVLLMAVNGVWYAKE